MPSVSRLIFDAYLHTDKPITFTSTNAERGTNTVPLQPPELFRGYDPDLTGQCFICGDELTHGGIRTKSFITDSFCNVDKARSPTSDVVCDACLFAMGTSSENRAAIRSYPIIATKDTFTLANIVQMRDALIDPPEPPFVLLLPTSNKKHIFLHAHIAYDRDMFPVQFEERTIWTDRAKLAAEILFVEALLGIGITHAEISAHTVGFSRIKTMPPEAIERINATLAAYAETREFDVAAFVAQKGEEEKSICYLDSLLQMPIMRQPLS